MNLWQKLTNLRKAWIFVQFLGTGHSWTLSTLMESIETSFSKITSSRYLICSFWNLHFSGCRNSLYLARISNTLQIAHIYSSIDLVKIRMLSRQTTTIFLVMRSQKILFIIIWKVAGLLVIPKNITRGSNRLQLVQKAVFYLSLGLIYILLNPHWTSSLVKYLAPHSCKTSSEIKRRSTCS